MKIFTKVLVLFLIAAGAAAAVQAQSKKTIIIVRHAEKDTSPGADQNDPPLTADGRRRAELLIKKIGGLRPGAVYSTNLKRTRETAEPIAKKRGLTVQFYDPRKPQELVDAIMKSPTKRFLIVGHSNTAPPLANLFGKKDIFKNLDDAEHGVIWIVRIRKGQVRKTEVVPY